MFAPRDSRVPSVIVHAVLILLLLFAQSSQWPVWASAAAYVDSALPAAGDAPAAAPTVTPTPTATSIAFPTPTPTPSSGAPILPTPGSTPPPVSSAIPIPDSSRVGRPTPTPTPVPIASAVLTEVGGQLVSPDGKVKVTLPQGALGERARIELTPKPLPVSSVLRFAWAFELKAFAVDRGDAGVKQFARDLDITIEYDERDVAGLEMAALRLYYLDEATGQWAALPGAVDKANRKLSATTNHFSFFGGGSTPAYSLPGLIMNFQNDLHSGTATASYPIELPPGPGGFQPKLELTYNSGVADEMKNARDVGSWVGIGWSLHLGRIWYNESQGKYYLELNGGSYELVWDQAGGYYHTKQEQYWKIVKVAGPPVWWKMWDKSGNYYEFGNSADSRQYRVSVDYRYDLNLMKDTHGNQMTVTYVQDIWAGIVRSAYPLDLNYGRSGAMNVRFNSGCFCTYDSTDGYLRADNPRSTSYYAAPQVIENKRLTSIEVRVSGSLLRKYVLDYTTSSAWEGYINEGQQWLLIYYSGQHTLTSIVQYGADDISVLPAVSFTYEGKETSFWDGTGTSECAQWGGVGNTLCFAWKHLTQVTNGYGGSVAYGYAQNPWPRIVGVWGRQVIMQKVTNSGIGGSDTHTYDYAGNPTYYAPNGDMFNAQYRGFTQVRETDAEGNYSEHYFHTTGVTWMTHPIYGTYSRDGDKLSGREYQTEWYSAAPSVQIRKVFNDWDHVDSVPGVTWHARIGNGGEFMNGVMTYWTWLNYGDYGNVLREDTNAGGAGTPDPRVYRGYYPSTAAWILDRLAWERRYTWWSADDRGLSMEQDTRYYYDNASSETTPPTKGDVTTIVRYEDVSIFATSSYQYDFYGNLTSEADPNGKTTGYEYDPAYETYLLTKTYPALPAPAGTFTEGQVWDYVLGQKTSSTDVNGQVTDYRYDTFGRLCEVWEPGDGAAGNPPYCNVALTPTVRYLYNYGTSVPVAQQNVEARQKTVEGDYQWQKEFFDGLGRVVQVQAEGEPNHTIIASTREYSTRGLVSKEYVSQDMASVVNQYQNPAGWKNTSYAYDALGRVTTQTKPDGTLVSHNYSVPLQDEVTNERGIKKRYTSDAYGRLVTAQELDGGGAVYSTTSYTYDARGNLKTVTDAAGNLTSINYDLLSRKTSMSDPDMGGWSYTYDSDGNLETQTDAIGTKLKFVYDALNRMTEKRQCTIADCSAYTVLASYGYDSIANGNYGKGKRTSMTDASGSMAYKYDVRGRLVEEVRTVDGTPYTTSYTYDSADRLEKVIYPGGEEVTQGYNGRGLPYSLKTNNPVSETFIASSVSYNGLGLPVEIKLGSNPSSPVNKTTYGYWNLGGAGDNATDCQPSSPTDCYGRLWRIQTNKEVAPTSVLQSVEHTWDATGNLTQRKELVVPETETFGYDFLDRLTTANATADVTSGLVGWWKLDETSGPTATDSSGAGNTGSLLPQPPNGTPPAPVDARLGKGLGFTRANNQYVGIANSGSLQNMTTMTVSAWAKTNSRDVRQSIVSKSQYEWDLRIWEDNRASFRMKNASGGTVCETWNTNSFTPAQYVWYHFAGTWDGVECKLYVNGVEEDRLPGGGTMAQLVNPLAIGGDGGGGNHFDGVIDEVRVYNRALTDKEVQSLYRMYAESYGYNQIGNVTGKNGVAYAYPPSGPGSVRPHAVTGIGTAAYTYDANGNMVSRGLQNQTLAWDAENRVTGISQGGNPLEAYVYDGDGQRVKKTSGGVTTVYVNKYYEVNTSAEPDVVTKYYYLGGRLVAVNKGVVLEYVHQDHLGGTALTTDVNGVEKSRTAYLPYGGQLGPVGSLGTDRKYTGQRYDNPAGLYYYNARYYDPEIGRFVSADSLVLDQANPQDFNRYAYVRNNPAKYTDPSGHFCIPCAVVAVVLVSKAVDYGWTAYDIWQANRTLANPRASAEDKAAAALTITLAAAFELAEPDEGLPIGLPLDDLARRAAIKAAAKESTHHIATNSNKKFTLIFEKIVGKYKLKLDDDWNKIQIPQNGRHPDDYHKWVQRELERIDRDAHGNTDEFLKLFDERIKKPLRENPDMIFKDYWDGLRD